MTNRTIGPNVFLYNVDVMDAFQTYLVRVRATTEVGPGPFSPTVIVTRDQEGMLCVCVCVPNYSNWLL